MKNYLEFKIPVQRNAQWYKELCEAMQEVRIPVRWQNGFYHITVAFMHDDLHVKELRETFARILSGKKAPSITLDRLETFQTQSGKELIINLAPSHPSDELLTLINELRSAAINSGSQISKDFFIHITLGRIDAEDADLDEIKDIISSISSTIGSSLNSFSIGGQTTEKSSEKGAMNDVNVQFLFGNMADFVQTYKIICICQLFFVPLQPILKLLL